MKKTIIIALCTFSAGTMFAQNQNNDQSLKLREQKAQSENAKQISEAKQKWAEFQKAQAEIQHKKEVTEVLPVNSNADGMGSAALSHKQNAPNAQSKPQPSSNPTSTGGYRSQESSKDNSNLKR